MEIPDKQTGNKRPEHLWKPGQSGNAKGRPPKVKCIPDILNKIGAELAPDGQSTKLDVVLEKVYALAMDGTPWAVEFIAERTEGRVPQTNINKNINTDDDIDYDILTDEQLDALEKAQSEIERIKAEAEGGQV
jgi:hypothetical protein